MRRLFISVRKESDKSNVKMIELKKYTIGTYKQHADDNSSTDFTRRIPTGLSDRQMERDAKITMQLVRIQQEGRQDAAERMIDLFRSKARLLSNPRYWELMRTVWVAAGSTETAPVFRTLMRSARPCRSWFMTPEDAADLDRMDYPLTVWRAFDMKYIDVLPKTTCPGDIVALPDTDPGISWTIDREWCMRYARLKGRVVKERQVQRSDIFAYVTRRGESEMIILE